MNQKKQDLSGLVNCLGWCNKQFYSNDRFRIRFCKKCSMRMDDEQKKNKLKPKFCSLDTEDD